MDKAGGDLKTDPWVALWGWAHPEPVYLQCRHHHSELLRSLPRREGPDHSRARTAPTGRYGPSCPWEGERSGMRRTHSQAA